MFAGHHGRTLFNGYTTLSGHTIDIREYIYCDQPFISETTRCVSDDFIEINDISGQNVVRFYVERIERGRELTTRETE
jgi:hypothetical protein